VVPVWWKLLLLFTVVPAVELFVLLQIGSLLGPTPTFLMLLLSGVVGAWLAKREGLTVMRQLSLDLQQGLPPAVRLAEGALVLVGALLLVTPGVLTDVAGLLILIPPVRRLLAPRLVTMLSARFAVEEPEPLGEGVRYKRPEPEVRPQVQPRPTPFSTPFD
jgi:UPF0716 protein FxsA